MDLHYHIRAHSIATLPRHWAFFALIVLATTLIENFWELLFGLPHFLAVGPGLYYPAVLLAAVAGGLFPAAAMFGLVLPARLLFVLWHPEHFVAPFGWEQGIEFALLGGSGMLVGAIRDHEQHERAEKDRLSEMFESYVSPEVLTYLRSADIHAEGAEKHATVLFCDLRNFTAFSENLKPPELLALLNRYFEGLVECLIQHGAYIDKFIGDAVMAVFGAPLEHAEDAHCAVRAALDMQRYLDAMNREQAFGNLRLSMGIGIHSGGVVAGDIGARSRREYTVIGDTVNLASRIEALNKTYGTRILISEDTRAVIRE